MIVPSSSLSKLAGVLAGGRPPPKDASTASKESKGVTIMPIPSIMVDECSVDGRSKPMPRRKTITTFSPQHFDLRPMIAHQLSLPQLSDNLDVPRPSRSRSRASSRCSARPSIAASDASDIPTYATATPTAYLSRCSTVSRASTARTALSRASRASRASRSSRAVRLEQAPRIRRLPRLLFWLSFFVFANIKVFLGKARVPITCNLLSVGCPSWPVQGYVKEGYAAVMEAFRQNFEEGTEVGAGFAAYVGQEKVVDLHGGWIDASFTRPYQPDTLQTVFSSSKVVEGLVTAYLVDRKHLDYEDKIAKHWPEFAQGNKENVTLKALLGHRAGVTYLSRGPTLDEIADLDRLAQILAAQPHNFDGKEIQGYAGITRGWYLNEIVRRAHPEKRTIGQILRHEIMPLLDAEFYVGLPQHLEHRISHLVAPPPIHSLVKIVTPNALQRNPPSPVVRAVINPLTIAHKALRVSAPQVYVPWPLSHNRRELWANEGPSFSGMSNARSLAKLAALLANRGELGDVKLFSEETAARAFTPLDEQMDTVVGRRLTFTMGGWGYRVKFPCCPDFEWIGWGGVGGSLVYWNPEHRIAFSYVPNSMG
ncbi:hypothetical protein HDU96_004829 [Phlyctochytrium bullatum]|nr:hypothetical protein HDU96_004829 [Phlyctochytrium bullatum]